SLGSTTQDNQAPKGRQQSRVKSERNPVRQLSVAASRLARIHWTITQGSQSLALGLTLPLLRSLISNGSPPPRKLTVCVTTSHENPGAIKFIIFSGFLISWRLIHSVASSRSSRPRSPAIISPKR